MGLASSCGSWFRTPGIHVPPEGGREAKGARDVPSKEAKTSPRLVEMRGSRGALQGSKGQGHSQESRGLQRYLPALLSELGTLAWTGGVVAVFYCGKGKEGREEQSRGVL